LTKPAALSHQKESSSNPCVGETPPRPSHDDVDDDDDAMDSVLSRLHTRTRTPNTEREEERVRASSLLLCRDVRLTE
jgi:hypothetical protein